VKLFSKLTIMISHTVYHTLILIACESRNVKLNELYVYIVIFTAQRLPVSLDCPVLIAPSVFSNVYLSCVLCTMCCQFLWIVQFWLPLRYSLTFICPVSCVPCVASFSGLSSFYCPFDILSDIYMFLISDILNNIKTNWSNTGTCRNTRSHQCNQTGGGNK
jgi:hypothetical protein